MDYNDQPLHRLEPSYLEHYGLFEPPFAAVADERFTVMTPEAGQRMSLLVHMTQYSDMVLMVLADEGMGKTTLLQNYIKAAHDNWHICRINANTMMDRDQLLFRIAEDFGLDTLPADSAELQELLYDKMTRLHQNDVLPVIIVDDAHELPVDAISQLFIMAEIKAGDVTMVHVVLFGKPDLEKTIQASTAGKIRERIGHSFDLHPLSETDTADYVYSRLSTAGLQGDNPFSPKVIKQIHKQSAGVPARINELAHRALDEAQAGNEPAFDETDDEAETAVTNRLFTPLRIAAVLSVTAIAGLGLWQQDRINAFFTSPPQAGMEQVQQAESQPDESGNPFARLKQNIVELEPDKGEEPTGETDRPVATANLDRIEMPAIAEQLQSPVEAAALNQIEPASLIGSRKKQTLTLHGSHFSTDTEVTLSWAGRQKTLPKSRLRVDNDKQIRIELVTGKQADNWQVSVRNPGQEQASRGSFKVTQAQPAAPTTAAQWVAAQPATNLTLQLLGSHSLKPIQQYIKRYQLSSEAIVYKTRHANKDWYVLFYGSYRDSRQALEVIDHLPDTAKANKPWIRSFASIRARQSSRKSKPATKTVMRHKAPELQNIESHQAWLWSQDPSHYTLQLLGTQNVDRIKQFIKQHRLRGKVVYYHTLRDNRDWYALVYGVYPNNTDARTAVADLPAPIKKLSPWVRNFSAIHAEMDQAQTAVDPAKPSP